MCLKIGSYTIPLKIIKGKMMIDQWMEWATLPFDNPIVPQIRSWAASSRRFMSDAKR